MTVYDSLSLPIAAMWQQKARTVLTTLGVIFGSFVLTASISIGQGVQEFIEKEARRNNYLRTISVGSGWKPAKSETPAETIEVVGQMSDARRARIREAIAEHKNRYLAREPLPLTKENIQSLAAMDHVEAVVPNIWQRGFGVLNQKSQQALIGTVQNDIWRQNRLVAGRPFESDHEHAAIVSEFFLYQLGVTDESAMDGILQTKIRIEIHPDYRKPGLQLIKTGRTSEPSREEIVIFEKITAQLPAMLDTFDLTPDQIQEFRKSLDQPAATVAEIVTEEFPIVGVVRASTLEERKEYVDLGSGDFSGVILPPYTSLDLFVRTPGHENDRVDATVIVDDVENTNDVFQRIKAAGWKAEAPIELVERERLMYLLIFAGMTCVAGVALLVAALGIANTMLISVLERTREIGIMKAVGASNGQLQSIFLIEGALIGLVGGGVGLFLAWAASKPGDSWVRSLVSHNLKIEMTESLFVFPGWLIVTVLGFAIVVTTLAAIYPARRAANVDPVAALRHE